MATASNISIDVIEGVLAESKADVLVNSTNKGLKLNIGALSKSLLNAAGRKLQNECFKTYPKGIDHGKVAVTKGYRIKCQYVYHGALPGLEMLGIIDPIQILCDFVCACLQRAHDDKMASIAFPPLGCGFLDYPPEVSAQTMFQCFTKFEADHPGTSLRCIYIVIFPKGEDWKHIKKIFLNEFDTVPNRSTADKDDLTLSMSRRQERYPKSVVPVNVYVRKRSSNSCEKTLGCGHACAGYTQEPSCPPCLEKGCLPNQQQNGEDDCVICYTDELFSAPVIVLKCGHVFHLHCANRVLETKWVGARITFSFMTCPICKQPMEHPELQQLLSPIIALQDDVRRKAMMRIQYEGLDKSDAVTKPGGDYYRDALRMAMERYCYYPCYKCGKAYFGGTVQCDASAQDREFDLKDLVCAGCSGTKRDQVCKNHGTDFIEYKCRYCCSIAIFFCGGHTHFCNACHGEAWKMWNLTVFPGCPAGPCGVQLTGTCPLNIEHPPTGTEFSLGCGLCANEQTF